MAVPGVRVEKKRKLREIPKGFPAVSVRMHGGLGTAEPRRATRGMARCGTKHLGHVHFSDFFHQPLAGGGLLLFAHDARLFVVLALLHFRKNAGLLHLLLETAQGNVEIVIVVVEKNSGQEYHPLRRAGQAAKSTALQNMKSLYSAGLKKKQVPNLENQTREARRVLRRRRRRGSAKKRWFFADGPAKIKSMTMLESFAIGIPERFNVEIVETPWRL